MDIRTVSIIGVTGTMGANVAGIFASFGDAKVYCIGRDLEKVKGTIPRMVKSVKADAIRRNLIPADYSMLEKCVSESDLIFESVKEDICLKKEIASRIGNAMRNDAITCTGTSGLSVTALAECYPAELRSNFFGVHMFNPPYSMPLCEFISTVYSDEARENELKDYLKTKLNRTIVEVKDSPAFLANRIGFQFINEALQYAEKYKDNGGIDYIDAILGPFTGRAMPPLRTSDFVGLDVHKAIVDNLYANTSDYAHETFLMPGFALKLIEKGNLGRKSGGGLYKLMRYDSGLTRMMVYDIATGSYRDVIPYVFPFAESMKRHISHGNYKKAFEKLINNNSLEARICLSFILKYIVYSLYTASEVGFRINAADDVMATGFNWCPPLAMYNALSQSADILSLIKRDLPGISEQIDVDKLLAGIGESQYNYRIYFKSGR